jgi:uncharacterized protein YaaR (DUF327 family)
MTETTDQQKLAKQTVDEMVKDLRRGKDIYEQFYEAAESRLMIQGKTMVQWKKHFSVHVPQNPDISACKEIDMKLMELYQEAAFLKAMAEAAAALQRKGYETQYRNKFEALVAEYKATGQKLPAKDTLENLAKKTVDDIETGTTYSDLAVRFWKEVIENLNYIRKLIENATINNSVEAKIAERNM